MKRTLSIPAVVLIAVVALVLGTFGSATAAGITKGQVKKIAAKVVDKKASSLTVAKAATADSATLALNATNATNATNAGNAANLGGVPASAYAKRLFIRVAYTTAAPTKISGSDGVTTNGESALGLPRVVFPQDMTNCAVVAIAQTGGSTEVVRRSSTSSGTQIVFGINDDTGASSRANFDVIAVC